MRRRGNGKIVFNGYRVSVWEDGKVLEMGIGDGCKDNVRGLNAAELHT